MERILQSFLFFLIGLVKLWLPQEILVSDWVISKYSPLKPQCQMESNFTGSIYWMFFTKRPRFDTVGLQTWRCYPGLHTFDYHIN